MAQAGLFSGLCERVSKVKYLIVVLVLPAADKLAREMKGGRARSIQRHTGGAPLPAKKAA
jgi:hypothetical protein